MWESGKRGEVGENKMKKKNTFEKQNCNATIIVAHWWADRPVVEMAEANEGP